MRKDEGIPGRTAKLKKDAADDVFRHSKELRLFELGHHRPFYLKHGLPSKKPSYRQVQTSSDTPGDRNDENGSKFTNLCAYFMVIK